MSRKTILPIPVITIICILSGMVLTSPASGSTSSMKQVGSDALIPPYEGVGSLMDSPVLGTMPDNDTHQTNDAKPLDIGISEAIILSLENNKAFVVQQFSPAIIRAQEQKQEAAFDPVLSGQISYNLTHAPGATDDGFKSSDTATAELSIDKDLPTGTSLGIELSTDNRESSPTNTSRVGLTATQALLKGFGRETNLAQIRQARIDTIVSEYELRAFAESLIAQVEQAYWDYALAERQIDISHQSLKLAEQQLEETKKRINVGQLAKMELIAAQAEAALRQEALINAKSALETARLKLLRLINPPGNNLWNRPVSLQDIPRLPEEDLSNPGGHVLLALRMRPDINQARLQLEHDDLEIVRTKNGLLPRMDGFISLGTTGYSDSFGSSLKDLSGEGYDIQIGITTEFPWKRRQVRAEHRQAALNRRQAVEAIENLSQLIELEVRSTFIEAMRLKEQVPATKATRVLQEEKLRAETEKFRVGKSTSLLVAQAQRDLVASQIGEIQSLVNYLKAIVELYHVDGTLLQRRGIVAPGNRSRYLKEADDLQETD